MALKCDFYIILPERASALIVAGGIISELWGWLPTSSGIKPVMLAIPFDICFWLWYKLRAQIRSGFF